MFVSFGEVLVVVTAAGLLLGKQEIKAGARYLGIGLGRMVGMLQGVRIKYEEKSRGTQLYELHRSVKRGLDDVGTIGSDLQSIGSGNFSSRRAPFRPPHVIASPSFSSSSSSSAGTVAAATAVNPPAAAAAAAAAANSARGVNDDTERLARLIVAEGYLPSSSSPLPLESIKERQTVDVVAQGVRESILAETYARMVPPAPPAKHDPQPPNRE